MFEVSEIIYSVLNGYAPLKALITKVSPIIAFQESDLNFVNYSIEKLSKYTKESTGNFRVTVNCWATKYDDTLKIADQVEAAIGAATQTFTFISSTPQFSDEGIYFTQSIYEFKK